MFSAGNMSMSSNNNFSTTNNKKATMWDNVGNVNINLDNLSLKGNNQKKGMPMNAMVTPNSSPQKVGQAAFGGAMGPPPLQAPPAGGSGAGQPSSGFDSLNDLLN